MPKPIRLIADGQEWIAEIDGGRVSLAGVNAPIMVRDLGGGAFDTESASGRRAGIAAMAGDAIWVSVDGHTFEFTKSAGAARGGARDLDALTPPMSATVVRIAVKPGDQVKKGQSLIVLEAMKMELPIRAPHDGTIGAIRCKEGEIVQPGSVLIDIT